MLRVEKYHRRLSRLSNALALGIALPVGRVLNGLVQQANVTRVEALGWEILVVVLVAVLGGHLLEAALQRATVARRLLLGSHFVEGLWADLVLINGRPAKLGLVSFSIQDGQLRYSGHNYDLDGRPLGEFSSEHGWFDWPSYRFISTDQDSEDPVLYVTSYGHLQFGEATWRGARRFTGLCRNLSRDETHRIIGVRLPRRVRRKLAAPLIRRDTLRNLAKGLSKECLAPGKYGAADGVRPDST